MYMKKLLLLLMICLTGLAVSCNTVSEEPTSPIEEQESPAVEEPTISWDVSFEPTWDGKRPTDTYTYPLVPGMEEWASLQTTNEMYDACQVPSIVLKQMSTQAIIQTIIEYPIPIWLFQHGIFQYWFELIFAGNTNLTGASVGNNAYLELIERKDAGVALLDRLLLTDPLTGLMTGPPKFESQMVELLLSQTALLSQVDSHVEDIARIAFRNHELRQAEWAKWVEYANFDQLATKVISPFLMGRTMLIAGYAPFVEAVNNDELLKYYLDGMRFEPSSNEICTFPYDTVGYYDDLPKQIIHFGKLFLTKK